MARVTLSSARWRCRRPGGVARGPRALEAEPGDVAAGGDRGLPEGFEEPRLAGPRRPHTTRFSRRATHSRVRMAAWVAAGIDDKAGSHTAKDLPGESRPRRAVWPDWNVPAPPAPRPTRPGGPRRAPSVASGRWPARRGRPGGCAGGAAIVAAPRLVGQRRGGGDRGGHEPTPLTSTAVRNLMAESIQLRASTPGWSQRGWLTARARLGDELWIL